MPNDRGSHWAHEQVLTVLPNAEYLIHLAGVYVHWFGWTIVATPSPDLDDGWEIGIYTEIAWQTTGEMYIESFDVPATELVATFDYLTDMSAVPVTPEEFDAMHTDFVFVTLRDKFENVEPYWPPGATFEVGPWTFIIVDGFDGEGMVTIGIYQTILRADIDDGDPVDLTVPLATLVVPADDMLPSVEYLVAVAAQTPDEKIAALNALRERRADRG